MKSVSSRVLSTENYVSATTDLREYTPIHLQFFFPLRSYIIISLTDDVPHTRDEDIFMYVSMSVLIPHHLK